MIWLYNYIMLFSYEDFMINQRKLMFKKNITCELDFQPNAWGVMYGPSTATYGPFTVTHADLQRLQGSYFLGGK